MSHWDPWLVVCMVLWPMVIMGVIHNILVEKKMGRPPEREEDDEDDFC